MFDELLNDVSKKPAKATRKPSGSGTPPEFREFLAELVKEFGGPMGLAREYFSTYKNTKSSSASRVQLILKISDLLLRNSQYFGTPPNVEEMSDRELVAALRMAFEKLGDQESVATAASEGEGES